MATDPQPKPRRPAAFTTSFVFGAIGVVLMLMGWVAGNDPLFLAGIAAGCLSLMAALWWRSQLVAAWHGRASGKNPLAG